MTARRLVVLLHRRAIMNGWRRDLEKTRPSPPRFRAVPILVGVVGLLTATLAGGCKSGSSPSCPDVCHFDAAGGDVGPTSTDGGDDTSTTTRGSPLCRPDPTGAPPRPRWSNLQSAPPNYRDLSVENDGFDSARLVASLFAKTVAETEDGSTRAGEPETGACVCNCTDRFGDCRIDWSTFPESDPGAVASWASEQCDGFARRCFTSQTTRGECRERCAGLDGGAAPPFDVEAIATEENHLWIPDAIFRTPRGRPTWAGELVDLIDGLPDFFAADGSCSTDADCSAENATCGPDGTCQSRLRQTLASLGDDGAEWNRATDTAAETYRNGSDRVGAAIDGEQLGGYAPRRADLHACIGWAGHGATATLESSATRSFVAGRYSSDQLAADHRAQRRRGALGIRAFGENLSLPAAREAHLQVEGFKQWSSSRPFGIEPPDRGIPLDEVGNWGLFRLVDQDDLSALAGAEGNPSRIAAGELVQNPHYPARYTGPDGETTYTWPRSEAAGEEPWMPWNGWSGEDRSFATLDIGPSFSLGIRPLETESFDQAGARRLQWRAVQIRWDDDARFLERVRSSLNAGLPEGAHLASADLRRSTEALQAPDLSDDLVTEVNTRSTSAASTRLQRPLSPAVDLAGAVQRTQRVRIEARGGGGVVDADAAVVRALQQSNPPDEASCDPDWTRDTDTSCTNTQFEGSDASLGCGPSDESSSCCITIGGESGDARTACVGDWTGLDRSFCEQLDDLAAADAEEPRQAILDWLDQLGTYVDEETIGPLREGLLAQSPPITAGSTWNEGESCAEASCDTTVELQGIASCGRLGRCIGPDGTQYDTTRRECFTEANEMLGQCCYRADDGTTTCECGVPRDACRSLTGGHFDLGHDRCTPRTWKPYQCHPEPEARVSDGQGPGCHPVDDGFPSACSCADDGDCAGDATCTDEGLCSSAADGACICGSASGEASSGEGCPTGRNCEDGACVKTCESDDACGPGLTCRSGACRPPGEIPTAEAVAADVRDPNPPGADHAITSYALSELRATAFAGLGADLGLEFPAFGGTQRLGVARLGELFDITALDETRYQPGLEARYSAQCAADSGQVVTNRQPEPTSAAEGTGVAADQNGVSRVGRYPETDIAPAGDPPVTGNACRSDGASCGTDDLVSWCRDELPDPASDPEAPTDGEFADALRDAAEWSEAVESTVRDGNRICVNGEPWRKWASQPNPGSEPLTCRFTGEQGDGEPFPCRRAHLEVLDRMGCLATDLSYYAELLADEYGDAITQSDRTETFDLEVLLEVPREGLSTSNLEQPYRGTVDPDFPDSVPAADWIDNVEQCFERKRAKAAKCRCDTDADCPGSPDATCGADGVCRRPDGRPAECAPLELVDPPEAALCCGDGEVQAHEACDDGNRRAGDGCSPQCQIPGPGACCRDGQCQPVEAGATCRDEGGTFHPGRSCSRVDCPPAGPTGACCVDDQCRPGVAESACQNHPDGTFVGDESCATVQCGDETDEGACCTAAGCRNDVSAQTCTEVDGEHHPDRSCNDVTCNSN